MLVDEMTTPNVGELNRRLADARLVYLMAVVLLAIAIWAVVKHFKPQAQLMLVQMADDLKVDEHAHSFRLVNVGQPVHPVISTQDGR